MPVAPQVGGIDRYHDHVPEAGGDVPVAARAEIGLQRLVGMNEADLEVADRFRILHVSAHEGPEHQECPHNEDGDDVGDVGRPTSAGALRVESHAASIAVRSVLAPSGVCSGTDRYIAPTVLDRDFHVQPLSEEEGIRCDTDCGARRDGGGVAVRHCGSRCWHC